MLRITTKTLVLLFAMVFSSQAFAKYIQSITGDLPSDLSENYFSITILIQPPDTPIETLDQSNVFKRVQVKVQSATLGQDVNAENADFYLDSMVQIQAGSGTNSTLVTYTIRGTKAGKLSTAATGGQITVVASLYNNAGSIMETTDPATTLKQFPYVPNEAPGNLQVKSKNEKLSVTYDQKSSIGYTGGQSRDATNTKIMAYYVPRKAAAVTFDAKIYDVSGTYASAAKVCTIDFNQVSGANCVTCNSDGNNYMLPDDMSSQVEGMSVIGPFVVNGSIDITGLSNDSEYTVFLAYQKGVQRSQCIHAKPQEDFSYAESKGEKTAKRSDVRCFLATSVYKNPLDPRIDLLRWLRGEYLMNTDLTRWLVRQYYHYSPKFIARYEDNFLFKAFSFSFVSLFVGQTAEINAWKNLGLSNFWSMTLSLAPWILLSFIFLSFVAIKIPAMNRSRAKRRVKKLR